MLKPYTILLLYPDYLANAFGQDTYQAWITDVNIERAIRSAQAIASQDNPESEPDDWYVLGTYSGHLEDHTPR